MSPQPGDPGVHNTEPISDGRIDTKPNATPAGPVSG